jgi:hypothetical protein
VFKGVARAAPLVFIDKSKFHMSIIVKATAVCLLLGLSSCRPSLYMSKEQSRSGNYGYEEIALDSITYQVIFQGDAGQEQSLVDRYALFRSAEVTKEKGFDYFVILETSGSRATSGMNMGGDGYAPGMSLRNHTFTIVKTIRLGRGARPDDKSAFDAGSMLSTMGPSIERYSDDR